MSAPLHTTTPQRAVRTAELIFAGPESLKARRVNHGSPTGATLPSFQERREEK